MADNEKTNIEVNVDLEGIESKLKTIDIGLEKARLAITAENQSIITAILQVSNVINLCTSSITDAIKEQFSSWLGTYSEEQKTEAIVNGITKAVDWAFEGVGLALNNKKQTSNEKPESPVKPIYTQLALPPGNSESSGEKNSIPISGNPGNKGTISASFGDPMSFTAAMGDLMESIGGVTTKLKESVLAWGAQTAAKIADKAEDAAIIALYAVDYVKQFGMMITQLAATTAAWVTNTAAKVANTAAAWAAQFYLPLHMS